MSTGFQGADPEDLKRFALDLEHAHDILLTVKNELNTRITSQLRWEGPDAFVFKHAWRSSYAPVILKAATMLEATAHTLKAQAAAQETASS